MMMLPVLCVEDVPGPEGRLISTEERMQQIQRSREDVDKQDTEGNCPFK